MRLFLAGQSRAANPLPGQSNIDPKAHYQALPQAGRGFERGSGGRGFPLKAAFLTTAALSQGAMLSTLSRIQAGLLIAVLVVACACAARLAPGASETDPAQARYSDMQLYHDVASRVAVGEDYYRAATGLQRAHNFPVRPFVTVREPTLALMAAGLGWKALQGFVVALLLAGAALWFRALDKAGAAASERIGAVLAILAGGAMASQQLLVAQHEMWAGFLLAIALVVRGTGRWPWAVLAAGLALAIRELALPFVLLALVFALWERRRAEAIGWGALIGLFALGIALHARAVLAVTMAGDPASQGWNAMRGPFAALVDLVDASLLNRLPGPLAYPLALLALLGWAAVPLRQTRFALLWFAGYALMLALFARAQNFYWAIVLLPAWFIGFAFLPRALRDLAQAALAGRAARL